MTTQIAGANFSTLAWTVPDQTPHPAGVTAVRGQIGALPWSRLRRVTEYIDQHLDRDLTLAELGAVAYMSPFHFARLFRRSTGLPPHRFVVGKRIDHAIALLLTRELSIAQIAGTVGFRTASHFATVFRRVTGLTPTAYQARLLRDGRSGEAR